MTEEIFPIEEIPAAKRRKRWAEAHAHIEQPVLIWTGNLIAQPIQPQFIKLIHEGGRRVVETSLDNMRKDRQFHEQTSIREHKRRQFHRYISKQNEQTNFLKRNVDKIQQS